MEDRWVFMEGGMDGSFVRPWGMDEWMDGWMDGWMDECMD